MHCAAKDSLSAWEGRDQGRGCCSRRWCWRCSRAEPRSSSAPPSSGSPRTCSSSSGSASPCIPHSRILQHKVSALTKVDYLLYQETSKGLGVPSMSPDGSCPEARHSLLLGLLVLVVVVNKTWYPCCFFKRCLNRWLRMGHIAYRFDNMTIKSICRWHFSTFLLPANLAAFTSVK